MPEQFPEQSPHSLPIVQEAVLDSVVQEMRERNILSELGHRLSTEQPVFAEYLSIYINFRTSDPDQQMCMFEAAMLAYHRSALKFNL
jgi:hypothetical protein